MLDQVLVHINSQKQVVYGEVLDRDQIKSSLRHVLEGKIQKDYHTKIWTMIQ